MKTGLSGKWLAGALMAAAIGVMTVFPAFASVKTVKLTFANSYETGTILEPQVYSRTSGVVVESVEWGKDLENWKPGQKVSVTVTLSSDDTFASSFNAQSCLISGGSFVSAKRDSGDLIVKAVYYPVVQLAAPESAGWSKLEENTAKWEKVEYATGYQLNLYCEDNYVRTVNVTTNKADLSEYMTDEGYYYYEVRATGKELNDLRYFKYSEYTVSEDIELDDLGDTDGRWKTYTTGKKYLKDDGTYATNEWYKILGKWYYFDENSHVVTGWKLVGPTWYYMDQDGVMQTGMIQVGETWYYLNNDGAMVTGWVQRTPSEWNYFKEDGSMAVNTVVDGYVIDENGVWLQN
ncbi:MAG: N-acetylmuramoyl-L-alanine amidase family protein [Lachnospiraceae bacterium]|nr:N-acetylmuramoyl-L-alanine amidase family protein [Lachnospiraceae bacterium]